MSAIYLGNMSVEQMEKRMGLTFPEDLKAFMADRHQANVNIPLAEGKWHCFDIPFVLACGDKETGRRIVEWLVPLESQITTPLHIAVAG